MASATNEYVTVRLTREELRNAISAVKFEAADSLEKARIAIAVGGSDRFWRERAHEMEAACRALMRHE